MTNFEILQLAVYHAGFKINSVEDLADLQQKLEENYIKVKEANVYEELQEFVLKVIEEDAIYPDFSDEMIRKALSLGYYPMSLEKLVASIEEYKQYFDLVSKVEPASEKSSYYWRYYLTIRHHLNKLIIDFDRFTFPKKTYRHVRQKFSDYTLTFNRNFDLCAKRIMERYQEEGTWLVPPLVKEFKQIHNHPDFQVSVDSVELWHGDELVAGELGFVTRNAYASLCGFHTENNSGTIQMAALGTLLKEMGFAYWDLGMEMDYKYVYGAVKMDRSAQKELFDKLSDTRLALPKETFRIGDVIKQK